MASPNAVILTDKNFDAEVLKSAVPVVVDFWAEWCGPCKMLAPALDELADEYAGKVKIGKLNIDDHSAMATQFNIQSIPTLLFFKGGQVMSQTVGVKSKSALKASINSLLA